MNKPRLTNKQLGYIKTLSNPFFAALHAVVWTTACYELSLWFAIAGVVFVAMSVYSYKVVIEEERLRERAIVFSAFMSALQDELLERE